MRLPLVLLAAVALAPGAARAQERNLPCTGRLAGGFPCANIDLLAHLPLADFGANSAAEVWGWVDPETEREYALLALNTAAAIVDVTTPASPVYLGRLPPPPGVSVSLWRELRVHDDHLFVGSEALGHGIQVFDLTRLRDVTAPPEIFTADAWYTGAGKTHTLVIDEERGYLYLAGANQAGFQCNGGGLHIVDVRDPRLPAFAGCFQDDNGAGDGDTYIHEADCRVYRGPDADYAGRELCVAYSEETVTFVDVTDKAAPSLIGRAFYPGAAYAHQGTFSEDWRFLLVDDELDEDGADPFPRTILLQVDDLDNPTFLRDFRGSTRSIDHNQYVRGRYLFQSNYTSGLRIRDLEGLGAASGTPPEVGFFDTLPERRSRSGEVVCAFPCDDLTFTGQWMNYPFLPSGNVLASDINNGLFVLRPTFVIVPPPPPVDGFSLTSPTPNPFTVEMRLTLVVEEAQRVRAEAYDALGRHVATLFEGPVTENVPYALVLSGRALVPGTYVVRVVGETFEAARRVILVR